MNFFCNPKFFYDPQIENYIEEYFISTKFNLPIANTVYSSDATTIDVFRLISEEMMACDKRSKEIAHGK
tara:strand:+ start:6741 stop:6947 length:207 start_codon:yes stop_codon:yes gene_type:complete